MLNRLRHNAASLRGADWEASREKLATSRAFGAAAAGALALPAAVAAVRLYRADGAPLSYHQPRDHSVADPTRPVEVYKLRTMVQDADKHPPLTVDKQNDPRIVPGMKWARDSGVDEFPQLLQTLLPKNHPDRLAFIGRRVMDDNDRERMEKADPAMYKDWAQSADTVLQPSVIGRGGIVAHQYELHDSGYQKARMRAEIGQAHHASFEEDVKIAWDTAVLMGGKIGERIMEKVVMLQDEAPADAPDGVESLYHEPAFDDDEPLRLEPVR